MPVRELPYVDEHSVVVGAEAGTVWGALLEVVDRSFGSGGSGVVVVRVLGCRDVSAGGARPLEVGSVLPGFHVVTADAPRELCLAGRHRFSDYMLAFRLTELEPGSVRVTAESRAAFPGLHGKAYRTMVIGSRGHVLAVRRLLASIKRHAERARS